MSEPFPFPKDILPCPLCGKSPTGYKLEDGFCGINCYNGHEVRVGENGEAEAIAAWNTRATDPHLKQLHEILKRMGWEIGAHDMNLATSLMDEAEAVLKACGFAPEATP